MPAPQATTLLLDAYRRQPREVGPQIATEALRRTRSVATVVGTPHEPGTKHVTLCLLELRPNLAVFIKEGPHRAIQFFELVDETSRGHRRDEVAAAVESVPPVERPGQDSWQFWLQAVEQPRILSPVEGILQRQHDEPRLQRARLILDAGQFVREQQESRLQHAGPVRQIFATDGLRVLVGYRQEFLDDHRRISTLEARVRDDGHRGVDQHLATKGSPETRKAWRADVTLAEQLPENAADGPLPRPLGSDDHEDLLQPRCTHEQVAKDLL